MYMRRTTKNVAAEVNAMRIGATCQAMLEGLIKFGVTPGGGGNAAVVPNVVTSIEVFMMGKPLS